MGEGWDGGGRLGLPPHLNLPPPWGEEVIFLAQLGYEYPFSTTLSSEFAGTT